jgi:hypothetical protein
MFNKTTKLALTRAHRSYDYTRVTRELLTGVVDKHGEHWRLVQIDTDPELGTFGANQVDRYASGPYATIELDELSSDDYLHLLGLPGRDNLVAQARAHHDAEVRAAVHAVCAEDDPEAVIRDLARAVALILMIDAHPADNPETIELTPTTRHQLRAALGLED